jgi:hypothetical protein
MLLRQLWHAFAGPLECVAKRAEFSEARPLADEGVVAAHARRRSSMQAQYPNDCAL